MFGFNREPQDVITKAVYQCAILTNVTMSRKDNTQSILRYIDLFDKLIDYANNVFGAENILVNRITDNDDVFDIEIVHKPAAQKDPVSEIRVSFDKDAGFFMDISAATWEFEDDSEAFIETVRKYIDAMAAGKLRLKHVKLFGLIPIRTEVLIEH